MRRMSTWITTGLVALVAAVVLAQEFDSPVIFKNDVRMDTGARQIDKAGTALTATYAQLNAGLASSVSNNLLTNAVLTIVSNAVGVAAATSVAAVNLSAGTNVTAANVAGNLPIATATNLAATLGSKIGGNIPFADFTNAFYTAPWVTQVVTGATNVYYASGLRQSGTAGM